MNDTQQGLAEALSEAYPGPCALHPYQVGQN